MSLPAPDQTLSLYEHAWEENGPEDDPGARLYLSGIALGPVPLHAEAIAVVRDEHGVQRAADPGCADTLDWLFQALQPDGGWETVRIGSRRYVVILHPHSA